MILFCFSQGIGNVVQQIPLYLSLLDKHEVDACYVKQYPTDSIEKASLVPCDDIAEVTLYELEELMNQYEYVVRPPFLTKFNGKEHDYLREIQDDFCELDSEVNRNLKLLKHFGIDRYLKRGLKVGKSHHTGDIVVHNGCVKGWEVKKYPQMDKVIHILKQRGHDVTCIGKPEEYCGGKNATGTSLITTAGTIANHKVYLGTDTGTYHIAAMMEKPGVSIFTATDPWKNWDCQFHKSISVAHTYLPCQPCQTGYHFSPDWVCKEQKCKNVSPLQIVSMVEDKLG